MKFLWISGWAVPPVWLAAQARAVWPGAEHEACSPSEAAKAIVDKKFHVLGGYSLGALCVLQEAGKVPKNTPVILLAPIFAFTAEQDCGGRVARAQLRLQRRRLRTNPRAALEDFSRRSGLNELFPIVGEPKPETIPALDEELGWLETWRATPPANKNWQGFVGGQDPLLDATALKKIWPELHIVADATHAPKELMQAARKIFLDNKQ